MNTETQTDDDTHVWTYGNWRLEMRDAGPEGRPGSVRVAYRFTDAGRVIFEGDDFGSSPCHAWDSDQSVAALLHFLSLRPGDTDPDYFDDYTPEQLAWAETNGEELSMIAMELEYPEGD